ncbi:DUF397 domain-containing protein [Streptomyces sp. NBC_01431]|uniref:DUF397 domain-containing protein n=1 Tax=Streptomyces sp. NBC_01431 TaxID=2903863 RepID=UPI002E377695|nr:DUF397 domain-containing protein [Streptomyces sp. NBC_01431]
MVTGLPATGWHKSSYSDDFDNACVEVSRRIVDGVTVRDSKDLDRPGLAVSSGAWTGFLTALGSR